VEVGVAESSDDGWILQALIADDELSFHGGVEVVLFDPAGDAFGKRVVVERVAEFGYWSVYLEDFIDGAGVACALGTDETDVEGRDLGVFEPGVE